MKMNNLFTLLRSALWNTAIQEELDVQELESVLQEAEKQTVAPLVFEAMERAKVTLPRKVVLRQMVLRQQAVQQNRKMDGEAVALARLLQEHDVDYVVVKGQVVATCYPHPELRQAGDIDFFCDKENYDKAVETITKAWGIDFKEKTVFHEGFDHQGVSLEMHHTLVHFYNTQKDAYWTQLLKDTPTTTVTIEGQDINTLCPTLHTLYVWLHLFNHLLELGVGLRQFCDWAMLLHHYRNEIDHEAIRQHLKRLGLEKAYRACGCILVDELGLPSEEFSYPLTAADRRYARRILDVVFYRGNMGKYNKRSGFHGWRHQLESAGIKTSHFLKFYPLAPSFMRSWLWGVVRSHL